MLKAALLPHTDLIILLYEKKSIAGETHFFK